MSKDGKSKIEEAFNELSEAKKAQVNALLFGETFELLYRGLASNEESNSVEMFFDTVRDDPGWEYMRKLRLNDAFAFIGGDAGGLVAVKKRNPVDPAIVERVFGAIQTHPGLTIGEIRKQLKGVDGKLVKKAVAKLMLSKRIESAKKGNAKVGTTYKAKRV